MMDVPYIQPLGDSAFVIRFGDAISPQVHERVVGVFHSLESCREGWVVDLVPGYASVMVIYDALRAQPEDVRRWITEAMAHVRTESRTYRVLEIPVWYHPSVGPDLEPLAHEKGLSVEALIGLHTHPEYLVYMLGFRPGFPFLGGLDPQLFAARLSTPRAVVPAGSVGIGGQQTGIYPVKSPGGWRLLGRTPLKLFSPEAESPFALGVGDRVRFVSIPEERYRELGGEVPS
jgi:inhibitor of KinA